MGLLMDAINDQAKAGRKTITLAAGEVKDAVEALDSPRARWLAAGVLVAGAAAAVGMGVILYRRRRRTLAQRLQRALPDSFKDQLKRPLQRAVRAL